MEAIKTLVQERVKKKNKQDVNDGLLEIALGIPFLILGLIFMVIILSLLLIFVGLFIKLPVSLFSQD